MLETDSLLARNWISVKKARDPGVSKLIEECKVWIRKYWETSIQHVKRECNTAAYSLASIAMDHLQDEIQ